MSLGAWTTLCKKATWDLQYDIHLFSYTETSADVQTEVGLIQPEPMSTLSWVFCYGREACKENFQNKSLTLKFSERIYSTST